MISCWHDSNVLISWRVFRTLLFASSRRPPVTPRQIEGIWANFRGVNFRGVRIRPTHTVMPGTSHAAGGTEHLSADRLAEDLARDRAVAAAWAAEHSSWQVPFSHSDIRDHHDQSYR